MKAKAEAARDSDNLLEAIDLYSKLVVLRPKWAEGWWFLGTLQYDADDYEPAARSFSRFTLLQPKNGHGWAMRGLCEYKLKAYAPALQHLVKARSLGIGDNEELARVVRYHQAVLFNMGRQFDAAQALLMGFANEQRESDPVLLALGQALLRIGIPAENLSKQQQEVARRLGKAAFLAAARNATEAGKIMDELLTAHSQIPNLHYACGILALRLKDSERGLAFFKQELEKDPRNVAVLLQTAFQEIGLGRFSEAWPYASRVLEIEPENFSAHYALGRIHLELGDLPKAIASLETAARLAPQASSVQFVLARAYSRARRPADAARARAEFARLEALEKRQGPALDDGASLHSTEAVRPPLN